MAELTDDSGVAETVRTWVDRVMPGDAAAADRAAAVALRARAHGATVSEACREARVFVKSWANHPSRPRSAQQAPAQLAS